MIQQLPVLPETFFARPAEQVAREHELIGRLLLNRQADGEPPWASYGQSIKCSAQMRRVLPLAASLLLPATLQLLLASAVSTASLLVTQAASQAMTADDYLAQAKALLGKKGSEQEVVRLADQALGLRQSAEAYFYRASAKHD